MDYRQIKKQANEILKNKTIECSYIEYKSSEQQLDKILKTICAYGNNYYNNDIQYIFIGVEEENNEDNKAVPVLPIKGISEGRLEKCKNTINSFKASFQIGRCRRCLKPSQITPRLDRHQTAKIPVFQEKPPVPQLADRRFR